MMNQQDIIDKLVSFTKENLIFDNDVILPLDRSLVLDGYIDSYALVELIVFIEKQWNVSININDVTSDNFGSLIKISQYIIKLL